jgi:hypothetical protein
MILQELLERVLSEVDKHVRASKGYETESWINPLAPVDSVAAFTMARVLTEQHLFDVCISVAPEGHVYGYFFEKCFGASILSVHVDYPPRCCHVLDDLDAVRGKRVLILEDDVSLPANLGLILAEALQHAQRFDLLRLSGLHRGTPIRVVRLKCGHDLSCNYTTQTDSGAYLVNRKCARQMLEHLLPMWLPYDHALDRDWAYGVRAMCLDPMPVSQHSAFGSQIDADRPFKLPALWRYWTVLRYRSWTETLRVLHRTREIVRQKQDTSSGPSG